MNPPFFLFPFDRRRPRLSEPRADFVAEVEGRSFKCRAQNGLLFCRDLSREDEEFTFALQTPLSPVLEAFPEQQRAFFEQEWSAGRVARLALYFAPRQPPRPFPLFFAPNGTGFCRETWNRDDLPFTHDVSFHDWLEAPASHLAATYGDGIFNRQIAPQLELLDWTSERDVGREWKCGSREELSEICGWACALEDSIQSCDAFLVRLSWRSENPFGRGGVEAIECGVQRESVEYDPQTDERRRSEWGLHNLQLSERFWRLMDIAFDLNTAWGFLFDVDDRFVGRLSAGPLARDFALQIPKHRLPSADEARQKLELWLAPHFSSEQIEQLLSDDASHPI